MPHSTVSEPLLSDGWVEEDIILSDAPEQVPDPAKEEGKMDINNGASQSEDSIGEASRTDIKLEDLFNDVNDDDDDDEFSGLRASSTNNESNPPGAPL